MSLTAERIAEIKASPPSRTQHEFDELCDLAVAALSPRHIEVDIGAALAALQASPELGEQMMAALRALPAPAPVERGEVLREPTCEDCNGPVHVWFAPNKLWNRVKGGPDATDDPGGMLCPNCFIMRAEAAGIVPTAWVLDVETLPASPSTGAPKP